MEKTKKWKVFESLTHEYFLKIYTYYTKLFLNFINAVTRRDLVIPSIGKIANQSEIVCRNYKHLQQTYI